MNNQEIFDQLEETLKASGLTIPSETLKEIASQKAGRYELKTTRIVGNEPKDSTLYFHLSDHEPVTFTEIKEGNFQFLKDQMKGVGIDPTVIPLLREAMIQGLPKVEIPLRMRDEQKNEISTNLELSLAKNGFYYWNLYTYQLLNQPEGQKAGTPQKVFIDDKHWTNNYKVAEMTALMLEKSIEKELVNKKGETYTTGKVIDFSQKDDYGNFVKRSFTFDLNAALLGLPIKEIANDAYRSQITKQLKTVQTAQVTYVYGTTEMEMIIKLLSDNKTLQASQLTDLETKKRQIVEQIRNYPDQTLSETSTKAEAKTPSSETKTSEVTARKKPKKSLRAR